MSTVQNEFFKKPKKGAVLHAEGGIHKAILDFLRKSLEKKCFDALFIPVKVHDTDSYVWVLLKDKSLLNEANPLPPVISVQGGRALSTLTKHGEMNLQIAAIMRPCEIRSVIELFKLKQVSLNNITLISIDCPGAMPLSDYISNPKEMAKRFNNLFETWEENESLRPICIICHRFSLSSLLPSISRQSASVELEGIDSPASDIHIGLVGGNGEKIFLMPVSSKGEEILEKLEIAIEDSLEDWEIKEKELRDKKENKRKKILQELKAKIEGPKKFVAVFDQCINCHNCMRVCPICYCRQCYFDSKTLRLSPEVYLTRAKERKSLRFPLDTLLFHLGRMSHMVLSCVSCGVCEDACPMNIPIAQVFCIVADQVQKSFGYVPGRDRREPPPLRFFQEDEFQEVEMQYKKTISREETQNA